MKREDIRVRDPFILLDNGVYYMYGTTNLKDGLDAKNIFSVYTSKDLEEFDGPYVIFDGAKECFWATQDYWAAEVWKYNGKYYLFGSFKSENHRRATQILVSDSPIGPFKAFSDNVITPAKWECLDGTLWIENDVPYMVFCHEWTQCKDGEILAVELSKDLGEIVGTPFLLFKASDNPYVTYIYVDGYSGKVTDGPFLHRVSDGRLMMIWSSFRKKGAGHAYVEAMAYSDNGRLDGNWIHAPRLLMSDNGGHGMLFLDKSGDMRMVLHAPNMRPFERAEILIVRENKEDGLLEVIE